MTDEDDDVIRINVGPMKQALAGAGRTVGIGAIVAGVGLMQIIGVIFALLWAALSWWLSYVAYDVHWLIGFPLRLLAVALSIGVAFALIGAAVSILVAVIGGLIAIIKGNRLD